MSATPSKARKLQEEFRTGLGSASYVEQLFEHLPDVYFFAKDRAGRFVMANRSFAEKCGGRHVVDFFPEDLARNYIADDMQVMRTGRGIINRVELFRDSDGMLNWYITSKIPLFNHEGDVVGTAGIARDVRQTGRAVLPYEQMRDVIAYIRDHLGEKIRVVELAGIVNLSVSQFQRRFRSVFHVSPMQYVNRLRLNAACRLLLETNDTITSIAQQCGFYDHSYFTKQVVRHMGIRPKEYRKQYGGTADSKSQISPPPEPRLLTRSGSPRSEV